MGSKDTAPPGMQPRSGPGVGPTRFYSPTIPETMFKDITSLTSDPQTSGYAGQYNGVRFMITRAVTGWTARIEGHGKAIGLNSVEDAVAKAKSIIDN